MPASRGSRSSPPGSSAPRAAGPRRPARGRDDFLLPVARGRRQPPSARRSQPACRPGSPRGPPPATTSPAPASGGPATPDPWPRSPASPKPRSGTRFPRWPAPRRRTPARPRCHRLPTLHRPDRAPCPRPGPPPRAPADLHTAPRLARPRHPDRPHRRPGHHPRLPPRFPPRPAARRHQARARRDDRAPAGGRHAPQPGCPPARLGARLIQPRPGPWTPRHDRSSGLPGDNQDGHRNPQQPRQNIRRAAISGKPRPRHSAGQLR